MSRLLALTRNNAQLVFREEIAGPAIKAYCLGLWLIECIHDYVNGIRVLACGASQPRLRRQNAVDAGTEFNCCDPQNGVADAWESQAIQLL